MDSDEVAEVFATPYFGGLFEGKKKENWTRVHSLQQRWIPRNVIHPVGKDVQDTYSMVMGLSNPDEKHWQPLFDPD